MPDPNDMQFHDAAEDAESIDAADRIEEQAEDEVLDIVTADQDQTAAIVDRGCIHDGQAGYAVASTGDECTASQSPQDPKQEKERKDNRKKQKDESRHGGKTFSDDAGQPFGHERSLSWSGRRECFPKLK